MADEIKFSDYDEEQGQPDFVIQLRQELWKMIQLSDYYMLEAFDKLARLHCDDRGKPELG